MPTKGKYLAITGLVLQLVPVFGMVSTAASMIRAFSQLQNASTQAPEALASDISLALYTTAIGMGVSIIGIILLCIALFGTKYRAPWFKTAMWILSIVWLFNIPIGTIIGIIVIIYLSNHRNEFTQQWVPGYPPQGVGSPEP